MTETLLEVRGLEKSYTARKRTVTAVAGVDLNVETGSTHGLVGESGCGKSTLARCVLRLVEPNAGSITFAGRDVRSMDSDELRAFRQKAQIVFQDPAGSLNPRQDIGSVVGEPLLVHELVAKAERKARVVSLLEAVGMSSADIDRFPHQFSGGQRQRIVIARALASSPDLIVCDEPVSALDVSVRAQILMLLGDLQAKFGVAYLFISHDLAVVDQVASWVSVMYLGRIVESGPRREVFNHPTHPYTKALLSAVPIPDPRQERARDRIVLHGDPPNPSRPPSGCAFRTRCWKAQPVCAEVTPVLVGASHKVACHFPE